jgi:hypothetical protein
MNILRKKKESKEDFRAWLLDLHQKANLSSKASLTAKVFGSFDSGHGSSIAFHREFDAKFIYMLNMELVFSGGSTTVFIHPEDVGSFTRVEGSHEIVKIHSKHGTLTIRDVK